MTNIRNLTAGYVAAFNARDLDKLAEYMAEKFTLTDPDVKALTPKSKVLDYIRDLFNAHEQMSFESHMIFVDGDTSIIHFTLTLNETVLDGVDLISWSSGRMTSMHAYLTQRR